MAGVKEIKADAKGFVGIALDFETCIIVAVCKNPPDDNTKGAG